MRTRTAALALAVLLTSACTGNGGESSDATTTSGRAPDAVPSSPPSGASTSTASTSSSATPQPTGNDVQPSGSTKCAVGAADIAIFSRDWARVAGAVGRPDIEEYTAPLVSEVDDLAKRAAACPGAEHAVELTKLIRSIDEGAGSGEVDLVDINAFQSEGNAWLKALGYGESALPTG